MPRPHWPVSSDGVVLALIQGCDAQAVPPCTAAESAPICLSKFVLGVPRRAPPRECVHDGVPRNESSQAAMPSSLLTEGLTLGRHTGSSISHVTFIYFL